MKIRSFGVCFNERCYESISCRRLCSAIDDCRTSQFSECSFIVGAELEIPSRRLGMGRVVVHNMVAAIRLPWHLQGTMAERPGNQWRLGSFRGYKLQLQ